ncbi:MAG: PcfJ domain-containing protein [Tyzzerella sp.]|nr:PcfJ domain-containing protein [Tyzzerella sp.]
MRKKAIEQLTPTKTKKGGWSVTVQTLDRILILNVYKDRLLQGRHCINADTREYEQWDEKKKEWHHKKLVNLLGYTGTWYSHCEAEKRLKMTAEEEKIIFDMFSKKYKSDSTFDVIDNAETDREREKRYKAEEGRWNRVKEVMEKVPKLQEGISDWIFEKAGNIDYAFYDKKQKKWYCTACEKSYGEKYLHRIDGGEKIRHNDMVICPRCKKVIQAKKRTRTQTMQTHFMILQPLDELRSVARHFDVEIEWSTDGRTIDMLESTRVTLFKLKHSPKYVCDIYWKQWGLFDNKGNPQNRRMYSGYLYEENIEECLSDTAYEPWARLFKQLAIAGKKLNYNRLMATQNDPDFINTIEYLFKGKFNRLLQESSEDISLWSCKYFGPLHKNGKNIEEVFEIKDRQKINRIRDLDGGKKILDWMRWSDQTGKKIPQDVLEWLLKNNLERSDTKFIAERMSLQQIMNYVKRQQEEGYSGRSTKAILEQWKDYLNMCVCLKKRTADEMVYRPRELKKRHDEAVMEIELRNAEINADEYSARFPGAEDVLKEIKHKFEYENDEYIIIVPERLAEIIAEGRVLHHCAGATDRYFDRIKQRETYICFCRKKAEPKVPYYTIEVEPGGTIRQHRGYLDEEPEIEKVKPFLREWQQVLRKKLSKKDREYAQISAVKREKNIEELKAKNNTRVLNGLMEDFMEAV